MPPFDQEVKQAVDKYFAAADGDTTTRTELGLKTGSEKPVTPAIDALNGLRANTDDEVFEKAALAIASDPRITKHLPELALDAIIGADELRKRDHAAIEFNPRVNKDGDPATISKAELMGAANDSKSFDPVHRRALNYTAANFDLFRKLSPSDRKILQQPDEENLTSNDLFVAAHRVYARHRQAHEAQDQARLQGIETIYRSFDKIDANKSGEISASESSEWLRSINERPHDWYRAFLPKHTNRMVQGTELMSRADVWDTWQNVADEIEANPPFFRSPYWSGRYPFGGQHRRGSD